MPAKRPKAPPADLDEAVDAGDVEAARRFLDAGAPVDAPNRWGATPLHRACGFLHANGLELARLLLERGADPNAFPERDEPGLFKAAYSGDDALCRLLLERGARTDGAHGMDRHTLLHCAAAGGLAWLVQRCLAEGQGVEAKSAQGHTPLQYAVDAQSYREDRAKDTAAVARLLLEAGADLHYDNAGSGWGTALHWAAGRGDAAGVRLLLDRGARVDARATPGGEQPVHAAAHYGQPESLTLLLERGADPNALDDAGWTPLHLAAQRGDAAKVKLLLAAGAKADAVSTAPRRVMSEAYATRKTPLDVARRKKAGEAAALLEAAARSGTGSRSGRSPRSRSSPAARPGRRPRS